jgi:aerobic carbon-monoxide dehydrogenase medium subunit
MKPAPFAYHRPGDLADALDRLTELNAHGEEVKVLAGGQSLIPMMNFRLARPSHLVDIGRLREHAGIRFDGSGLRIGALTTHHEVELARLPEGFDMLNRAMRWIGHLPIRTRGTVGGSLVHGDATAEWCLLALILDARIVAVSPTGRREILAEDMFHGFYETEAAPEEIVTEIILPAPAPHAALTEFAQRRGDFAIVGGAVRLDVDPSGVLRGARVALGGVDPAPVRSASAEAVLTGGVPAGALFAACAEAAAADISPPDDVHGSSEYRRRLTRALVKAACIQAWRNA